MIEEIIAIFSPYPTLLIYIVGFLSLVIIVILFLFIFAYRQGRGFSVWGLILDPKQESEKMDSKKKSVEKSSDIGSSTEEHLTIGIERYPLEHLQNKITIIQQQHKSGSDMQIALLGSTYVDVILGPISTTRLEPDEWPDLEKVSVNIGGSAMCVGRYLWLDYGRKTNLFTPVSQESDIFSEEFRRLLNAETETWLLQDGLVQYFGAGAPVTIILRQIDRKYTTMFTYRGVLATFNWSDVHQKLASVVSKGGVLYMSGFLKTNLSSQLVSNLQSIHSNTVICIDHGRLNPRTYDPAQLRNIYEAFSAKLIDIYICSFSEIVNYCRVISGKDRQADPDRIREVLEDIAKTEILPPVTIVRDTLGDHAIVAFSIVGGVIDSIPDHSRRWFDHTPVAPLNAFNAAVLHNIIATPLESADGLRGYFVEVSEKALKACHRQRDNDRNKV